MIQSLHSYSLTRAFSLTLTDAVLGGAVVAVLYAEFLRQFLPSAVGGLLQHGIVFGTFALMTLQKMLSKKLGQSELWLAILGLGLVALSVLGSHSKGMVTDIVSTVLLIKLGYISCIAAVFGAEKLVRLIPLLAALQVFGLMFNLALPGVIGSMIPQVYGWLDKSDLVGLQLNVNRFGILAALLFTWYWFIKPDFILAMIMLFCLVMSASRSGTMLLVIFVSYFSVRGSSHRVALSVVLCGLACFPVGYILRDFVDAGLEFLRQSLMVETAYIRTIMLMHGGNLAVENFPIGTGGGTFGSPLSLGSVVYSEIGIADLPTVEHGHGINDSGVGSLLGEYGFLGFFLVLTCVAQLLRSVAPGRLSAADVAFLLLVFALGSLFRAMISSYYYATVMVLLAAMLCVHQPRKRRAPEPL